MLQWFLVSGSPEAPSLRFGWGTGDSVSTATGRNPTSDTSEPSVKAVKGVGGEQAADRSLQGGWSALPGNADLSKCRVPWSRGKTGFTLMPCYVCPHRTAPGAAVPCGISTPCCRRDSPFTAQNLPAGPELLGPGFLFFPYACGQAWRSEPAGGRGREGQHKHRDSH